MAELPNVSDLDSALDEPLTDAESVVVALSLLQVAIKYGNSRDDLYRRTGEIIDQMQDLLPGT